MDGEGVEQWSTNYQYNYGPEVQILEESDGFLISGHTPTSAYQSAINKAPYLFKIDAQGNTLWSYELNNGSMDLEYLSFVTTLDTGEYLIVGTYRNTSGGPFGRFMARLSRDRTTISYIPLAGELTSGYHMTAGAALLENGDVCVLEGQSGYGYQIHRYQIDGTRLWSHSLSGEDFRPDHWSAKVIERSNELTFGGSVSVGRVRYTELTTLDSNGVKGHFYKSP